MVCSTERSTPGSAQGNERASSLTLKTAVNPESEESLTQFQRNAYSRSPSLFFHSFDRLTLQPSRDRPSSKQLRQCPLQSKRDKASRQAQPRVRRRLRLGRLARGWLESSRGQHGRCAWPCCHRPRRFILEQRTGRGKGCRLGDVFGMPVVRYVLLAVPVQTIKNRFLLLWFGVDERKQLLPHLLGEVDQALRNIQILPGRLRAVKRAVDEIVRRQLFPGPRVHQGRNLELRADACYRLGPVLQEILEPDEGPAVVAGGPLGEQHGVEPAGRAVGVEQGHTLVPVELAPHHLRRMAEHGYHMNGGVQFLADPAPQR